MVNADEGEPSTFKDRMLVERDPHQLVEGIAIAAFAVQCNLAFVYLRGEFALGYERLTQAIADARAKGFLGKNILGSGFDLDIVVHRGAGAYICGEETALLESLEGERGHAAHPAAVPRDRGPLREADRREQRRDAVDGAAHRARWAARSTPSSASTARPARASSRCRVT